MSESSTPNPEDGETHRTNEREVTDPITHLPLTIHDTDTVELERIPPPPTAAEEKKLEAQRGANSKEESNARHIDMENVVREAVDASWWEDPIGDQRRARVQSSAVSAISAAVGAFLLVILWLMFRRVFRGKTFGISVLEFFLLPFVCCALGLLVGSAGMLFGFYQKAEEFPDGLKGEKTDTQKSPSVLHKDGQKTESAHWLNSFLNSVWPIVNPSLFIGVADMLEDSMQATLPKLVRGVRVADIGQGSESVRILGIRLLDAGSAAQDVDGMKAEEGDFVNMEVAVAYRAKETTVSGMRGRSANAHLLVEFWVAGGLKVPVWVELTGFLATVRVRIQLTPNPPFLSLMTVTLLGLPKVTLKCTPLVKNFLNVMDVPGLSSWIQKSINLVVQEYVAPRSVTIDLKTLLMGRPKMDTDAAGVVIVTVRRVEGCRGGTALLKSNDGKNGDLYVTLGWSKWGKPLWSTRIIAGADPVWEETTALLVGPSELNGKEGLQLQVWDSDRFTVDDLMGNVELSLQDIMSNELSLNHMCPRHDGLVEESGNPCPGALIWECGYFEKTTFEQHVENKHQDAGEIRRKIDIEAQEKLREAKTRGAQTEDDEIEQSKKEDMKEKTDELVATSKPTSEWPSGILSIKIEQISGLEIEKIKDSGVREDNEDEDEDEEGLPSSYCTVILNEQRVYKTRTKMKSNNPFFDAGTEKFIRNWQTTNIIISVRDDRLHEVNPIIGFVVLPLRDVFKHRSELTDSFPLVGGIGYGRLRLSLVFRSVQLQLPKRLLGWDVGTIEISPDVKSSSGFPQEYNSCRLFFHTPYGKGKMVPKHSGDGWNSKKGKPIRLAVKKRYASCLLLQLRKHAVGADPIAAFATLWLKEIPDNEALSLSLPVYENADDAVEHAQKNAVAGSSKQVGTLNLTVRFWPGLSGYHKAMADHDKNMTDVMEVLDYVETMQAKSQKLQDEESQAGSSSSSSGDEDSVGEDENGNASKPDGLSVKVGASGQFKDFRKKQGELHHKHRGLMQWKAMRNVAWIGRGLENKASKISDSVKGTFKHQSYEAGPEKEV